MAEDGSEKEAGVEKGSQPESPWTALLRTLGSKALTALLTVGGLATFAAFVGSVVLWTRFDALQLPPDQIIDVAPRGELVAVGATMLLLFGFCGGVAALAVYLIDRGGRATPGMSRGVLVIIALEAMTAVWLAGGTDTLDRIVATEVIVLAFGAILWATFVGGLVDLIEEVPDPHREERVQRVEKSAFRNERNKWDEGPAKARRALALAVTVGIVGWLIAWSVADGDPTWGWLCGLIGFGLMLLLSVFAQWRAFASDQAGERQLERERAEARRKALLEKRAHEEEERKQAARKAEEEAEEARKSSRIAGVVSWLKATWGEEGLTLSLGRPRTDPRPPDDWIPRGPKSVPTSKPPSSELTPQGLTLVVSLTLVATVMPAVILGELWLAETMVAIIGLGLGLWRISQLAAGRFLWYGLAVLISVPLFGTVALASRNLEDPQVQPVAIIRDGDGPAEALQGLYVTENDDRVYFANVATQGCEKDIVGDSGRLLWVPKEEVVAMAIGPLQDVDKAARASLEMAQSLTPDVETPGGARISVEAPGEPAEHGEAANTVDKGEAEDLGRRLESTGPAIRRKFGRGISLDPETARPGAQVELKLSAPEYGGFANLPVGSSLRLNGLELPIVQRENADGEFEDIWEEDRIKFEVPEGARSGVVWLECTQLAGQPHLTVPRKPAGRIAVQMQTGSRRVVFDSSLSSDDRDKSDELRRTWTVAGLRRGHAVSVGADLPPRLTPYRITLKLTDSEDQTDKVDLQLLRLPQARFPFGAPEPENTKPAKRVLGALRRVLDGPAREDLAAIEIDGHADSVDTDRFNFALSLARARWIRSHLFALHNDEDAGGAGSKALLVNEDDDPVPLIIRAFGESCPIVRKLGPQQINRRVEVFLLGHGVSVATPKGCRAGRLRRLNW